MLISMIVIFGFYLEKNTWSLLSHSETLEWVLGRSTNRRPKDRPLSIAQMQLRPTPNGLDWSLEIRPRNLLQ